MDGTEPLAAPAFLLDPADHGMLPVAAHMLSDPQLVGVPASLGTTYASATATTSATGTGHDSSPAMAALGAHDDSTAVSAPPAAGALPPASPSAAHSSMDPELWDVQGLGWAPAPTDGLLFAATPAAPGGQGGSGPWAPGAPPLYESPLALAEVSAKLFNVHPSQLSPTVHDELVRILNDQRQAVSLRGLVRREQGGVAGGCDSGPRLALRCWAWRPSPARLSSGRPRAPPPQARLHIPHD